MMRKISTLIITIIILTQTVCSQNSEPYFGWDLTYESVLERNNVDRKEWIWKWLNFTYKDEFNSKFETPAKKWIAEWNGKPIISSILIDYPAFHAAEHTTMWFFRTIDKAYFWEFIDDSSSNLEKQDLDIKVYDKIYEQMSSWQQAVPPRAEDLPTDAPPGGVSFFTGYIGFLGLYEKGKSCQMLLTMEDFVICNSKECCTPECKTLKSGRLLVAIEPVISK